MAASFTVSPSGLLVFGQPLIYTVQTSTTPTAAFRIVITIDEKDSGGTYQLIGKYYLSLNSASRVHFDLNDVIKNMPKMEVVNGTGTDLHRSAIATSTTGTPATLSNRPLRVGCGEFNGTTETLRDATVETVLCWGFQNVRGSFNVDHLTIYGVGTGKPKYWMVEQDYDPSTLTTTIYADPDDEGVVAGVVNDAVLGGGANTVDTMAVLVMNGLSVVQTGTRSITTTNGFPNPAGDQTVRGATVAHVAAYPRQILTWLSVTAPWTHYLVYFMNSAATQVTSTLQVRNECSRLRSGTTRLAFANTVGGWNYYNFEGRRQRDLNRRQKTVNQVTGVYDAATYSIPVGQGDTTTFGIEVTEKYTLNAIVPFRDRRLIEVAFKSRQHMIQLEPGQDFIPVVLDTSTVRIKDEPSSQISQVSLDVTTANQILC